METRAETPSVEEDGEVEVVETGGAAARPQPRIVLKATRSARPREQVGSLTVDGSILARLSS